MEKLIAFPYRRAIKSLSNEDASVLKSQEEKNFNLRFQKARTPGKGKEPCTASNAQKELKIQSSRKDEPRGRAPQTGLLVYLAMGKVDPAGKSVNPPPPPFSTSTSPPKLFFFSFFISCVALLFLPLTSLLLFLCVSY